ncbi:FmdB family zinc ribbon protein [Paraburkholderia kururiensis]|uniref:FmdB family zinc ribbon protein n=1 Tax=Paraburkholderia kururiensis TaxID=984307 RepID=UPI000F85E408|nr:zinc ribbon domain-containing protein [Paraburkholderia kururiensis]
MPIYDFECANCGPFAVMRRIADRDMPCRCADCGGEASRVMTAPALALMAGASRIAQATNERAAHAPRQSADGPPLRHRPGCSCCSSGRTPLAGASTQTSAALKRPAGRPWMISH